MVNRLKNTDESTTDLEWHSWYRLRRRGDFNQAGAFGCGGVYGGGAVVRESRLTPRKCRARFHVHFQSDKVHAEQGVLSTDEATERRRWRMIVTGVLPEVAEPDRAFDELWDHFGRPDSWRCYPDVAPVLDSLAEQGISVCVGSNFDGRLRGVVKGLPELKDRNGIVGHFVGSWFQKTTSVIFSCRVRPAWACRRPRCCAWGTTRKTTCAGRSVRVSRGFCSIGASVRTDDLPHVPNLTALIERKSSES